MISNPLTETPECFNKCKRGSKDNETKRVTPTIHLFKAF